jgi:uracil-DNA glycosylase
VTLKLHRNRGEESVNGVGRNGPSGAGHGDSSEGGDLPPRPECAQLWLQQLLARLPLIELTLLIGQYAQRHFLGKRCKMSLAKTTRAWAAKTKSRVWRAITSRATQAGSAAAYSLVHFQKTASTPVGGSRVIA